MGLPLAPPARPLSTTKGGESTAAVHARRSEVEPEESEGSDEDSPAKSESDKMDIDDQGGDAGLGDKEPGECYGLLCFIIGLLIYAS